MHYSAFTGLAIAGIATVAQADFEIYTVDIFNIDQGVNDFTFLFGGEPSCSDVGAAIPISNRDDASSGGIRWKIADTAVPVADWDVEEVELNIEDWGHFTLYKDRDYVSTPADGGDIAGTCVRDTGDDFTCTSNIQTETGSRVFICTSDLGGV